MALSDIAFPSSNWIRSVEVVDSCSSTSDLLRDRLLDTPCESSDSPDDCQGTVLVARHQTQGRGRKTRDWWTGPPDSNLALTACLAPPDPPLAGGLMAACAIAKVGEIFSGRPAALKWPNDVLLQTKPQGWAKFCGILSEIPAKKPACLLVGIGANVRASPPREVAPYPTTCVEPNANLEDFLTAFLTEWEQMWVNYNQNGPLNLENEFFTRLCAWAPNGIRIPGEPDLLSGRLLEFSVSKGLSWGETDNFITRPLGLLPTLEAL